MERKRIVSGIRPTGDLHVGHYLGVLRNWVELQKEYQCFYFAADWHAENLPEEASTIALRSYLAARLVLFSLAERNIETREELAAALAERLAMRRAAEIDLDAAGASLRMYEKGRVVPFPMDLFAGVLDAPAAAPVDSVVADPVPPPPPGG